LRPFKASSNFREQDLDDPGELAALGVRQVVETGLHGLETPLFAARLQGSAVGRRGFRLMVMAAPLPSGQRLKDPRTVLTAFLAARNDWETLRA
jgi:hypothetical protein